MYSVVTGGVEEYPGEDAHRGPATSRTAFLDI